MYCIRYIYRLVFDLVVSGCVAATLLDKVDRDYLNNLRPLPIEGHLTRIPPT